MSKPDPTVPPTLEEIRRRVDVLLEKLLEELQAIDAEAGEKRAEAMRRSGLPMELIESVLGHSSLTSPDHYAQNDRMAQEQSAPLARIGRPLKTKGAGPITRAARELGLSLTELADKLGTSLDAVRNWERPGRRIPDEFQPRLDALLAKAARDKAKAAK